MLHQFILRIMDNVIPTCIIHIFVLRIRTVFYIDCVLKHFRLSYFCVSVVSSQPPHNMMLQSNTKGISEFYEGAGMVGLH